MMKRIIFFLSLSLALAGCQKAVMPSFEDSKIVGYWECTEWNQVDGSAVMSQPVAVNINSDHSVQMYFDGSQRNLSWDLVGKKVVISGISDEETPQVNVSSYTGNTVIATAIFPDGTKVDATFVKTIKK